MKFLLGKRMGCLLVTSTLTCLSLPPALAQHYVGYLGGSGGILEEEICDRGYLTGFRLRHADEIDRLQLLCGDNYQLNDNNGEGVEAYGGHGGAAAATTCPEGLLIRGLDLRVGNRVDRLRLLCGTIYSEERDLQPEMAYGGRGGTPIRTVCSPGEGAIGLQIRHGSRIDAVGLICDD